MQLVRVIRTPCARQVELHVKELQRDLIDFFSIQYLVLTPFSGLHGSPGPPLCDITVYLYLVTLFCSPSHAPIDTLCTASLSHAVHTLLMLCAEVISEMNHCFPILKYRHTDSTETVFLCWYHDSISKTDKAQMMQINLWKTLVLKMSLYICVISAQFWRKCKNSGFAWCPLQSIWIHKWQPETVWSLFVVQK